MIIEDNLILNKSRFFAVALPTLAEIGLASSRRLEKVRFGAGTCIFRWSSQSSRRTTFGNCCIGTWDRQQAFRLVLQLNDDSVPKL